MATAKVKKDIDTSRSLFAKDTQPHVDDAGLNIYNLVLEHCDKTNDSYIKDIYLQHLSGLDKEKPFMQKIMLNRFISNALFMYRSKTDKSIVGILPFILVDGSNGDWFTCYIQFLHPFLAENKVYEIIYTENKE